MSQNAFSFSSEDVVDTDFIVVSFSGKESLSSLYQFEIEIKALETNEVDLGLVLDSPAKFLIKDGDDNILHPVYGVLASCDELHTALNYTHYRVVLVPRLWQLTTYKTNEIYTIEKTVDEIIRTVLTNADLAEGTDFDLNGLIAGQFLERDYVCQFGESDFDFISRLMENEGIFYYFESKEGESAEKIIFINDTSYPDVIDVESSAVKEILFDADDSTVNDCITKWSCRKQRLANSVSVRDFNPVRPSLDISDTMPIDSMGMGTEYIYGENVRSVEEATYLSNIRAEEQLCTKTRYYGGSSVGSLQAGHCFTLKHTNKPIYDNVVYLIVEIIHQGQVSDGSVHRDEERANRDGRERTNAPEYVNTFVAMEKIEQYRPPRVTKKPRFYGTMTAFIYAEVDSLNAEINEFGQYRVQLPFDRADSTMSTTSETDPDRKSSTWMRMAQPYVGQSQGMYFPLAGGTEVLLTFINGDPDQPVISGALPNASQPSLLNSKMNLQRTITAQVSQTVTGNTHKVSLNSAAITAQNILIGSNATGISNNAAAITDIQAKLMQAGTAVGSEEINQDIRHSDVIDRTTPLTGTQSMIPPWEGKPLSDPAYNESLIKFPLYNENFNTKEMDNREIKDEVDESNDDHEVVSTDRGAGDNYVYANGRTFAYPQHERVYFIGTFHEDFHVKDNFMEPSESWTGTKEQWNFPAPGKDYPAGTAANTHTDAQVNPNGVRGVSEDRRWGDQMTFAYGRQFNWGAGDEICGAGVTVNYGNGVTEDLINASGGRFADISLARRPNWDMHKETAKVAKPDRKAGTVPNPYTPNNYDAKFDNAGKALAAYTFVDGHTYSYQSGDDLDVNDGASDSWTFGDAKEWIFGHSCSWVNGDSISHTLGSETSMLFGNSNSMAIGFTTDTFVGLKTETFVGGKLEIELSAGITLSSTSESRADAKKDEIAVSESRAALKYNQDAASIMINSLKNDIKALNHRVDAANVDIKAAAKITLITATINITAVMIKLG